MKKRGSASRPLVGQLAVVTMAGGQGTRLGFNGPKGAFVFDPENNKSIFEALADTLKDACQEYGVNIPWYIMASRENFDETLAFFDEHGCFGYPGEISFFTQGELPMLDFDGKILLDEDYMVKFAADGHGGTLISMEKCGILSAMWLEDIKWVSINGVDNVLVKPVDPLFLGLTIREGLQCGTKTIAKTNPQENVGVLCRKNGHVGVVEYTEITPEMASRRDPKTGKLVFGDANALFNLFSIDALTMVAEAKLPYHVAVKKADYIDSSGMFVKGDAPNSYKFESFIFDAFELFDNICVLRVDREDEFAPIKNATGEDSPETALRMYRHQRGI